MAPRRHKFTEGQRFVAADLAYLELPPELQALIDSTTDPKAIRFIVEKLDKREKKRGVKRKVSVLQTVHRNMWKANPDNFRTHWHGWGKQGNGIDAGCLRRKKASRQAIKYWFIERKIKKRTHCKDLSRALRLGEKLAADQWLLLKDTLVKETYTDSHNNHRRYPSLAAYCESLRKRANQSGSQLVKDKYKDFVQVLTDSNARSWYQLEQFVAQRFELRKTKEVFRPPRATHTSYHCARRLLSWEGMIETYRSKSAVKEFVSPQKIMKLAEEREDGHLCVNQMHFEPQWFQVSILFHPVF